MPELRFEIDTGSYVKNLVGQFRAMRDASLHAISEGADYMIERMKDNLEQHKTGEGKPYYFRTDATRDEKHFPLTWKKTSFGTYITSAPGDPPAKLSGTLIDSLRKRVFFSRGHTRVIAEIYSEEDYAYYLEYGAIVGGSGGFPQSYMAPRPFMAPIIFSPEVNHRMLVLVRRSMEAAGQRYGAR